MAKDHHNAAGFNAVIGSIVFTVVFMIYLVTIHPGVSLDENKPAKAEETQP